ncbi:hypothetical protein M404DRAFT_36653 [Pisolithus tinctorius Marx 270]|uniref:Uncharacterized protein n=1 Tax=Pisolithus tinctorius Marx 270 TaxID=870435 RepID=A0A0C3NBD0_PISTI|nr:hypothetical protein M404DRAFT_36653 [Pisolithus tinctorius Marx 270]
MEEADDEWEAGREDEEEPETPYEGDPQEWGSPPAFERMARAAEQMAEAMEQTANEWGLYCEWAEWAEMRRREDACEAKMAKLKCKGGGWKRPQSEVAEDKNEEVDEGVEGDNEEEVKGEQEGGEEQEGGREQAMEE